jgi:molybdopterin molybdotransferase
VSEGLPGYLAVAGAVLMGAEPTAAVTPGSAVIMPTGGALPPGADAVVMIEYTTEAMPGTIEVVRPVAPGEGVVRADEDAKPGEVIIGGGRPLRPQDLGMLAAAGVTSVTVRKKPVVTIFSTGDEVVPADTPELKPGQVRDATAAALAALVTDAGGEPAFGGIVPDDPGSLEKALRGALPASDVLVVSAGSSVGIRDETANAVARLGPPGIWCHGLAIKPGKPTLLAECAGVPVIGLPGNPRSALVVFRLIGMPVVRLVGGCESPPPQPSTRARLSRDLASAAGRLDVVQVTVSEDGIATPVFGLSALLSVLTAADGYIVIPDEATGLGAGSEVEVIRYA